MKCKFKTNKKKSGRMQKEFIEQRKRKINAILLK